MSFRAGFPIVLGGLTGGFLLFAALPGAALRAQGLGEFSAPPPQPVPRQQEPAQRTPAPKRGAPAPRRKGAPSPAPRYEELIWFSRQLLCTGGGQICDEAATWPLQTEFDEEYFLRLSVPDSYCSPVFLTVEIDGVRRGTSGLLGPGKSEVLALGRLPSGEHLLRVTALGSKGGCNRGSLRSWGVDLSLSNNPSWRIPVKPAESADAAARLPGDQPAGLPAADPFASTGGRTSPDPSGRSGGIHVVDVMGRNLTARNAAALTSALAQARVEGARAVVVDLSSVDQIEEAGLRALFEGKAMYGGENFVLVSIEEAAWRFLEAHAPGSFRSYASEEAGIAALRR